MTLCVIYYTKTFALHITMLIHFFIFHTKNAIRQEKSSIQFNYLFNTSPNCLWHNAGRERTKGFGTNNSYGDKAEVIKRFNEQVQRLVLMKTPLLQHWQQVNGLPSRTRVTRALLINKKRSLRFLIKLTF